MERVAFTAPVGGDSKRIDNVELIPTGMQLCTFYGLADLGTQDSQKFGPKHKCQLAFEFPQEMRQFYEGDEMKPCAIFTDETLSMAPKSNLRKNYIENMVGKKLTEEEAKNFRIDELLGNHYVATISHSPDGKYANITSITPLSDKNRMMFGLTENKVTQINDSFFFHLSQGFNSESFKNLPKFVREKIKTSSEGLAHARSGGTFLEPDPSEFKNNNSNGGQVKKIKMLPDAEYTYEQYKAADWTDQMLIDNGKAKWDVPVEAPKPQSAPAPAGPSAPTASAPSPQPPQPEPTPMAPTAPREKKLVIKNGSALEDWIKQGWTPELMVEKGHAHYE